MTTPQADEDPIRRVDIWLNYDEYVEMRHRALLQRQTIKALGREIILKWLAEQPKEKKGKSR